MIQMPVTTLCGHRRLAGGILWWAILFCLCGLVYGQTREPIPAAKPSLPSSRRIGTLPLPQALGTAPRSTPQGTDLTAQARRGEGLFLQRCSLCHLPKSQPAKAPPSVLSLGPSLSTLLQGATPQKERSVREFIQKGSPRMPGFQYGLEPQELDDLMSFLKTL